MWCVAIFYLEKRRNHVYKMRKNKSVYVQSLFLVESFRDEWEKSPDVRNWLVSKQLP